MDRWDLVRSLTRVSTGYRWRQRGCRVPSWEGHGRNWLWRNRHLVWPVFVTETVFKCGPLPLLTLCTSGTTFLPRPVPVVLPWNFPSDPPHPGVFLSGLSVNTGSHCSRGVNLKWVKSTREVPPRSPGPYTGRLGKRSTSLTPTPGPPHSLRDLKSEVEDRTSWGGEARYVPSSGADLTGRVPSVRVPLWHGVHDTQVRSSRVTFPGIVPILVRLTTPGPAGRSERRTSWACPVPTWSQG